jgi:hypothetical protein
MVLEVGVEDAEAELESTRTNQAAQRLETRQDVAALVPADLRPRGSDPLASSDQILMPLRAQWYCRIRSTEDAGGLGDIAAAPRHAGAGA